MAQATLSAELIADIYQAAVDDTRWPDFAMLVGKAARIEHTGVWITENEEVIDISLAEIWRTLGGHTKSGSPEWTLGQTAWLVPRSNASCSDMSICAKTNW
jgi:hypothetical protein